MTEAELQAAVIETARLFKWRVHHVKPARTPDGKYLTRIAGDPGFPDLVLARDGFVIFAELKSEGGRLSRDQRAWLTALGDDPDVVRCETAVYVWRPSSWQDGTIVGVLR